MLKDAIEKILTLSAPTVVKDKETGMAWSDRKLYEMEPPKITKLNLPDLTALANFLGMEDNDTKGFIQVVSPQKVVHWSDMRDPWNFRDCYCEVHYGPSYFPFGGQIALEEFIIYLQTVFVQDANTTAILKLVGNLKDENVKQYSDDGISQSVTARVGLARVEDAKVPNPVILAPFRTFPEVEQAYSKFVLRLHQRKEGPPFVSLSEADGGLWELAAVANIREWLTKNINIEVV